jgi:hypothetical protein
VVRDVLANALPWTAFLPDDDLDVFLDELSLVARGAADLDNLVPVAVLLAQWRHTAEVHADPALRETLTAEPDGDLGPVPDFRRDSSDLSSVGDLSCHP